MVIDRIVNLLFPDVRKYVSWEELEERVFSLHAENERLNKAVEYAKKIMISARSQPDARETFMYNSGIWMEKLRKEDIE